MILATVGKVVKAAPIEGADRIHSVDVVCGQAGRWTGVVPKDIDVGALTLVFMPDALLPPDERWKFMEARGWRVRQARFKGAPSEVLILPDPPSSEIGADLTASLGVTKHDKTMFTPTSEIPYASALLGLAVLERYGLISSYWLGLMKVYCDALYYTGIA